MDTPFHAGELAVQKLAGTQFMASRVGRGINTDLPPGWGEFLTSQRVVGIGSIDDAGQVWASIVVGEPGILDVIDPTQVILRRDALAGDPLARNIAPDKPIGLLAIDLLDRQRMRLNGHVHSTTDGGLIVTLDQVFANCPKYIQSRAIDDSATALAASSPTHSQTTRLNAAQSAWIAQADTFFIASAQNGQEGVDVSHRGGNPGFIHVEDDYTLVIPDYSGNKMFNTLGNLAIHPNAGLIFVDFERGHTLQLTGTTAIVWDAIEPARFPGAERLVRFTTQQVIESHEVIPVPFRLLERSRHNPYLG
jgi:uncharacterized protein